MAAGVTLFMTHIVDQAVANDRPEVGSQFALAAERSQNFMIVFEQDLKNEIADHIVLVLKTGASALHVPYAVADLCVQNRMQGFDHMAIAGQECVDKLQIDGIQCVNGYASSMIENVLQIGRTSKKFLCYEVGLEKFYPRIKNVPI